MTVRAPAVAGSFYPAATAELTSTVDRLIAGVDVDGATPKALVVPHAGYVYSGPVAASGYARLRGDDRSRVVLIGPSHFTPLRGVAASGAEAWRTPLGDVPTEPPPAGIGVDDRAHAREHALEVQLPFLQRLLGRELRILPLAVGRGDPEAAADALEPLWTDPDAVLICSTDLSHYHDAATARRLDRRTAEAVVGRRPEAIGAADACGADALRALLVVARRHRDEITLLDLRNSADTAGDPSRVVGYGTFAVGTV